MSLDGRTAIVTGASRGIGLAVADRLVREGARVVITARKADVLADAVAQLGGPDKALAVAGKADDPDHRAEVIARAIDTFGSADLLVNNAGVNPAYGPMIDIDLNIARKMIEVNSLAPLGWIQDVHRAWMSEHGGSIVNVSSIAGVRPAPGIGMYGASKSMLAHITTELALELGPEVRVNAVAPAVVKTKFAAALYEGKEQELALSYPLKRLGIPEDVSDAVNFLLSPQASWITGQVLLIDGGFSLTGGM